MTKAVSDEVILVHANVRPKSILVLVELADCLGRCGVAERTSPAAREPTDPVHGFKPKRPLHCTRLDCDRWRRRRIGQACGEMEVEWGCSFIYRVDDEGVRAGFSVGETFALFSAWPSCRAQAQGARKTRCMCVCGLPFARCCIRRDDTKAEKKTLPSAEGAVSALAAVAWGEASRASRRCTCTTTLVDGTSTWSTATERR